MQETAVIEALKSVEDPEAGMNLADEAAAAIRAAAPTGIDVDVELVWDPPWNPERMSTEARRKFGW